MATIANENLEKIIKEGMSAALSVILGSIANNLNQQYPRKIKEYPIVDADSGTKSLGAIICVNKDIIRGIQQSEQTMLEYHVFLNADDPLVPRIVVMTQGPLPINGSKNPNKIEKSIQAAVDLRLQENYFTRFERKGYTVYVKALKEPSC